MKRILIVLVIGLALAGCRSGSFGKHGSLIKDRDYGVQVATAEMVKDCELINEVESGGNDMRNAKAYCKRLANEIGASHIVWTATEMDTNPYWGTTTVYVSGLAYRCDQ